MNTPVKKIRILLVDPDDVCRRIVAQRLSIAGYTVTQSADGSAALALAEKDPPQCIIAELDMPAINGRQFCQKCSAIKALSHIPIIMVSKKQMLNDTIAALDAGARDYITKPFAMPELEARIRAALRNT